MPGTPFLYRYNKIVGGGHGMIAAGRLVLWCWLYSSAIEIPYCLREKISPQYGALRLQLRVGNTIVYRYSLLGNNRAAIQLLVHQVNGNACPFVTIAKCPEKRIGTAIGGQQRGMDIQAAQA